MTAYASILVTLPGSISLDERDSFMDTARESGSCYAGIDQRTMLLSWEAPDLWVLRGILDEANRRLWEYLSGDADDPLGDAIQNAVASNDDTDLSILHYWEDPS